MPERVDSQPVTAVPSSAVAGAELVAGIVEAAAGELAPLLAQSEELKAFRQKRVSLSLADRRKIVGQALVLIEQNYVHLPHKAAMHAANPVQRLRLLEARLNHGGGESPQAAAEFHAEMAEIFHTLRDLHTNYLLPEPYAGRVAFLPFLVEEYFSGEEARYMVTKVVPGVDLHGLTTGSLVTHWNGMLIDRAVAVNAARYAGSNEAARRSRGVQSLTVRPLGIHRLPDEDWVVIRHTTQGKVSELTVPWLVTAKLPAMASVGRPDDSVSALGLDLDLDESQRVRKLLYAQRAAAAELRGTSTVAPAEMEIASRLPGVFRAFKRVVNGLEYGHLRIFTFLVDDPGSFVEEFVRLCDEMPRAGLILDVRGNGGGNILAAEMALQTLTPAKIQPEPTQFTTTPLNRHLCRQHPDDGGLIDLGPWLPSMEQSVETGATYSNAYSITPTVLANSIGQRYYGPVVLVTDARCYSATDIFAAGFADHGIGKVLGVDPNTGAGGANVWTYDLLRQFVTSQRGYPSPYTGLPAGVGMRVAIRRTLRVGTLAGTPVEDLGVLPDERHFMTRRDIERDNEALLAHAVRLLAGAPVRDLRVEGTVGANGILTLVMETSGIDRLDVWLDERPVRTIDVDAPTQRTRIRVPAAGARRLRIDGYSGNGLVAHRREVLGPVAGGAVGIQDRATLITSPASQVPIRFRFLVAAGSADHATVQEQVRAVFGDAWEVEPLFELGSDVADGARPAPDLKGYFAILGRLPRGGSDDLRRAEAFRMSRDLMRHTGYDVQPDLPSGSMYPTRGRFDEAGLETGSFGADEQGLPGTEDHMWALNSLRVPQAWARSGNRGEGVVVAQPDTGITAHPELNPGLDTTRDRDLLDNDADATDPLTKRWWWMDNPGHGTSTASVVISRDPGGADVIVGSAPGASLVPLRSNRSVVLVFDGDVARAVEYARQIGSHVITMSLGGVGFSPALRAAIDAAIRDGILVMAAAGNQVGFVVAPANYKEVIAVAASNIQDQPWSGSSHGPAVDITAPGETVPVARVEKDSTGAPAYSTGLGSGTSFAVALTAGVAALWLAHHGRDALIAKYGKANLQAVFADALRRTARRPQGWNAGEYGPGIVDADALLAVDLPAHVPPSASAVELAPADVISAAERLAAYLPDGSTATATAALDQLVGDTDDRDLYAGEIAYYMSQDPMISSSVAAAGGAMAADFQFGAAQQQFGLERLRQLASPSLAAHLNLKG